MVNYFEAGNDDLIPEKYLIEKNKDFLHQTKAVPRRKCSICKGIIVA